MANTLTGLIEYIYDSADVVSRELTGMIPAVAKNSKADQVAKDQNVTYDIVPDATAYDVTPSNAIPSLDSSTVAPGTMSIGEVRGVKFHWTGDDEVKVGREAKEGIQNNKFAQAFRTLANEMEEDLAQTYKSASRAYGTAGTTPFGTAGDFSDAAQAFKILKDNGAPTSDLQLVVDTAAGANILGKQARADVQGGSEALRRGVLLDIHGGQIRESGKIQTHTKGTANASYDTNGTFAVGVNDIDVDTGTGTLIAGDVINFSSNADINYVIGTALDTGTLSINNPGLIAAVGDGEDLALAANYSANMAFSKSAIHLLTRLPVMPEGGDQADDVMVIQDPVSGIFFQVAMYRAYRSVLFEVAVAWGVKPVKPAHMALLLG